MFADAEVTVHYHPDGYAHEYHHPAAGDAHAHEPPRRYKTRSLAHLETQLARNQRRRFWQRLLRPGGDANAHVVGGNEYIVTVDNLQNQEGFDQRRLLPFQIVEEDVNQAPRANAHMPIGEQQEGSGLVSQSTDSGIHVVAGSGLGDHPQVHQV